jgi:hypothetical protein
VINVCFRLLLRNASPVPLLIRGAVGKTLAYTSAHFINKDNEIVARGSHTKFVAIAFKDEKNITSELKPETSGLR